MSLPYRIQIIGRAARDLKRLPEKVGTACVEFVFGEFGVTTGPGAGACEHTVGHWPSHA